MFQMLKTIIALLDKGDRIKAGLLLFPMLVAAIVDVIGIAFVMPFIVVVADPDAIQTHKKLLYFSLIITIFIQHNLLLPVETIAILKTASDENIENQIKDLFDKTPENIFGCSF